MLYKLGACTSKKNHSDICMQIAELLRIRESVNYNNNYYTSVKIIKNEVGCRDDTVPKTVDTRKHCEEE